MKVYIDIPLLEKDKFLKPDYKTNIPLCFGLSLSWHTCEFGTWIRGKNIKGHHFFTVSVFLPYLTMRIVFYKKIEE